MPLRVNIDTAYGITAQYAEIVKVTNLNYPGDEPRCFITVLLYLDAQSRLDLKNSIGEDLEFQALGHKTFSEAQDYLKTLDKFAGAEDI